MKKPKSDNSEEIVVDKIVCEILSKLPVRSLVRFKSVCKPWRFLVENDPYLRDLHLIHSKTRPNFFVVLEKTEVGKALLVTADYLSIDEGSGKAVAALDIHNIREIDVPDTVRFFGPLNGLVGFYDSMKYRGIRLSNVCTQETTPWIQSTFLAKFKPKGEVVLRLAHCQLGFDPVTKSYKVACICIIKYSDFRCSNDVFCEVLTVGDHEWRTVENVPSCLTRYYIRRGSSVYLNGSIYYRTFSFMKIGWLDNDKIAVFDVCSERFRVIRIPDYIVYHPRDVDSPITSPVNLLDMDGHLALSCRIDDYQVKLWFYDNDDGYKSKNCWREDAIELPFAWDKDRWLTFHPVAGKDQIIMKSCQNYFVYKTRKGCNFSYHSYNWRKKTFTQLKINGIPSAIDHLFSHSNFDTIFVESLLPVQ